MSNLYSSSSKRFEQPRTTEFEVLKSAHKFLHHDEERDLTWEEEVARKYYSSLYREFAVCDLKHYKSGNFALRWRSEEEVLSGAGEETCGNTRCTHHEISRALPVPPLKTIELPFTYEEHNEQKFALVKVVLCDRCLKKLMWKREKEKEAAQKTANEEQASDPHEAPAGEGHTDETVDEHDQRRRQHKSRDKDLGDETRKSSKRRHRSRSRSPNYRHHSESRHARRRRSREVSLRKHDSGE